MKLMLSFVMVLSPVFAAEPPWSGNKVAITSVAVGGGLILATYLGSGGWRKNPFHREPKLSPPVPKVEQEAIDYARAHNLSTTEVDLVCIQENKLTVKIQVKTQELQSCNDGELIKRPIPWSTF